VDLAQIDVERWRGRASAAFQDHARLELVAREAVGVGDLAQLPVADAPLAALDRAGTTDLMGSLPTGLGTQLGPDWPDGVELSGGEWQKVALGRGMMRETPLVLVLDEPTAALDAETEHRLFDRYAAAARAAAVATGTVTVLVSHRFSTVRMADLIVVVAGGRVVEQGTHAELLAADGLYAELYGMQARAYR
jgi:ATP-binding cassette, subfamily B, bacterial